jgi:hypothetical protein
MAKHNKSRQRTWLKRKDADRHLLYQWSVQAPEFEVNFMDRVFRRLKGRRPLVLREDFCGTALLAASWVRSRTGRRAIGLDLDHETLKWGRRNNLNGLGEGSGNGTVTLLEEDVRRVTRPKADVACAYNFSYYLLHPMVKLVDYFRLVRRSLKKDGLFFMDSYGGWDSQRKLKEPRKIDGPAGRFEYVWDQADYNPIDNMATCYIHYGFSGGKQLRKAFTYHWRLYSPAEVCDALQLAGFSRTHVFWDRSEDEDLHEYRAAKRAHNTPGWLAYIVGEK